MKRAPVSRSALVQLTGTIATIVLFMVFVTWLHEGQPYASVSSAIDLTDETPEQEFISCERTLPEQDDIDQESEIVQGPVGRISSTEVNQCPRRFDGRLVTYIGEVVGDVLQRNGGAWLQVNDDDYALTDGPLPSHRRFTGTNSGLAVWMPDDLLPTIKDVGRRGVRGDVVRVVGILHRADPNDGGGLTVRARDVTLLSPAVDVAQPVHRTQAIAAALLSALAVFMIWRERRAAAIS